MPVNILITFVIGSILGWILVKVTKPPKHLKGLIIGACSAGMDSPAYKPPLKGGKVDDEISNRGSFNY